MPLHLKIEYSVRFNIYKYNFKDSEFISSVIVYFFLSQKYVVKNGYDKYTHL